MQRSTCPGRTHTVEKRIKNEEIIFTNPLVRADKYEQLMDRLEDYELGEIVKERQAEKHLAIEVSLDDFLARRAIGLFMKLIIRK